MTKVTSYLFVHRPERTVYYLPEITDEVKQCISEGVCPKDLVPCLFKPGSYENVGLFYLPSDIAAEVGQETVVGIEFRKTDEVPKEFEHLKTLVLPSRDVVIQSVSFDDVLDEETLNNLLIYAKNKRNEKSRFYRYVSGGLVTAFFAKEKLRLLFEIEILKEDRFISVMNLEDVTKEELYQRAYREPITGYYNWAWMGERLRNYHLCGVTDYAFVHFDIKDFKMLNELYNHSIADSHLKRITEHIDENSNWIYFGCRCDNDNFSLMIKDMPKEETLERLKLFFEEISRLDVDPDYRIYYRCGVVEMRYAMNSGEIVADYAKLAQAMGRGLNNTEINFYTNEMHEDVLWGKQLKAYLDTAISMNEFLVYFQPKVDLNTEKIIGAEALVRWNYKHKEFMTPYRFIPHLESDEAIIKIDDVVLHKVCQKLSEWKERGLSLFPISVNLSRKHMELKGLADYLARIVDIYGVDRSLIEFELTESSAQENQLYMISVLNDLKRHGFKISMDDFGTGYSSFSLLKEMPLDTLKIDKSFVDLIDQEDKKIQVIIRHIISMSKELGFSCIAEGAEDFSQVNILKELGCDTIQGYYYSRPISTDEFEKKYLIDFN